MKMEIIIYLLESKSDHRERQGQGEKENFHLSAHDPDGSDSWVWFRPVSGERFDSLTWRARDQALGHPLLLFLGLQRGAGWEVEQLQHEAVHIWGCWCCFIHFPTTLPCECSLYILMHTETSLLKKCLLRPNLHTSPNQCYWENHQNP